MPPIVDYRTLPFQVKNICSSGKSVGSKEYWRLYALENFFRILIHSVLSAQINANWLTYVITPAKQAQIQSMKQRYSSQVGATLPGPHDIYYLFLGDLNLIITNQQHLFVQVIPNVNQWIIKLEQIRLPRNIVGHMNWPNAQDRNRVDQTYREARLLLNRLSRSSISILIP